MSYVFPKSSSGISGLDEILKGGFPTGRTTLVTGNTGTGKTVVGPAKLFLNRQTLLIKVPNSFRFSKLLSGPFLECTAPRLVVVEYYFHTFSRAFQQFIMAASGYHACTDR